MSWRTPQNSRYVSLYSWKPLMAGTWKWGADLEDERPALATIFRATIRLLYCGVLCHDILWHIILDLPKSTKYLLRYLDILPRYSTVDVHVILCPKTGLQSCANTLGLQLARIIIFEMPVIFLCLAFAVVAMCTMCIHIYICIYIHLHVSAYCWWHRDMRHERQSL